MTPEPQTSQSQDPATAAEIARLGWWTVLLAVRSTTDLLDHPRADRT